MSMKTSSLSRKFLGRVLLLLLVGQIASLAWIYTDRKNTEEGELAGRAKLLAVMVSKSAARTMLDNYDFTYLNILVNEILNDKDILSVRFRDRDGKDFVFARNDDYRPSSSVSVDVPITTRLGKVGKICILYTLDNIRRELAGHIFLLLLAQAAVFLSLILLIRYFFRRDLGNRISRIGKVIEEVKEGDLLTRVDYRGVDEIGVIANGFDFLVENLAATIGKMRTISHDLSSSAGLVDHTLRQMTGKVEYQQEKTNAIFKSIDEGSNSQLQTLENTERLLALSRDNGIALEGIKTTFEGVVTSVDMLDDNVGTLYSSIAELRNSSRDVAALAESASLAVRDASVTMESINSSAEKIDTVVKESANLSIRVSEVISGKGIAAVSNTIDTMHTIESFFNTLSGTITQLDTSSGDIAKILTVIREVTEQAQLLSLNAQIIASQAGENGKSFAVVANEMKMLATKASGSTGEIEGIVKTIQREIRSTVDATRETSQNVRQGKSVVADAGEILHEIMAASSQSAELMKSIADSAIEQNSLIRTVINDIRTIRDLNGKVKLSTEEEEKSTSFLFNGVTQICDSMRTTRTATQEQSQALKTIVGNMETANKKTEEIAAASLDQQKVNVAIISSMTDALQMGNDMVDAVREVSTGITGFYRELERLKEEMEFFRTGPEEYIPLSGTQTQGKSSDYTLFTLPN